MDAPFNSGYMYSQDGASPHGRPQQHPTQQRQPNAPAAPSASGLNSFNAMQGHGGPPSHDSPSHDTLPPLQIQLAARGDYGSNNYSYTLPPSAGHPQPGSTPHTPVSSAISANSAGPFGAHVSSATPPGTMLPPSTFSQQSYGPPQQMMYPASTAASLSTANAPVGGLPTIQPRPPATFGGSLHGLPHLPTGLGPIGQQSQFMQSDDAPTHVVGSQGRRGILPSAPGRPNPPPQGTAQSTKSMIPQKDADGKFPCPHCNKTYLHAKHLKRHLLRHTGDRPYMCHLCKDTFSRSDILKRHFQKCSIRRGNPTGANHLAHQRRNNSNGSRLSISQQDGPIGLAGLQEISGTNYANTSPTVSGDLSGRSSRTNTISTPTTMSHRNSVAGLGIVGPGQTTTEHVGSTAAVHPGMPAYVMPTPGNPTQMQSNYAFNNSPMNGHMYNNNNDAQQMSFLGQQSSRFENSRTNSPHHQQPNGDGSGHPVEWNRIFNQGGQDGFMGSHPTNASSQSMTGLKNDCDHHKHEFNLQNGVNDQSFLGSLYSHPGAFGEYGENEEGTAEFPNWTSADLLHAKVDRLVQFCFPHGSYDSPGADLVRRCLTPEMVKHLVEHYTSYHGHWPFLHMPTFKLATAADGLVMAILCIGAIYSPSFDLAQTREMMEFVRMVVMANSSLYIDFLGGQMDGLGKVDWHIEEFQALLMFHSMFTWHGEPRHRQIAQHDFPALCNLAKCMDLFQHAPPGHYAHSPLHTITGTINGGVDAAGWNWQSWFEQEKRNRATYLLFLIDATAGIFFNHESLLDPFQIRLMLPADDAAWDARDPQECASALGLLGPVAQQSNMTGSRNPKQPGMREALRTLMEPTASFQLSATNAYAKFILIHAVIARVIACQSAATKPNSMFQSYDLAFGSSTPATPLSQHDWLEQRSGSASLSASSSGQATPTDGGDLHNLTIQQERKRLGYALDKWKRAWDQDIDLQYPPDPTATKRLGFSRDGVHFFHLGRSFLQSRRPADWTTPSDVRFKQVMELLKRIKGFVIGDREQKGHHDIGSVADIDDEYGLDDHLSLDMTLLFRPLNHSNDSTMGGVQIQPW